MSMLTGEEIKRQYDNGNLYIDPFIIERLNPNSYNLSLDKTLLVYKKNGEITVPSRDPKYRMVQPSVVLSTREKPEVEEIIIPEEGYVLEPGILYLGSTQEWTQTNCFIPAISGRSSTGRLGLCIHVTAGFGDIGFQGRWTLEMTVVHPLRVFAGDEIAQLYFETPEGRTDYLYNGRYQHQKGVVESRMADEKRGAV